MTGRSRLARLGLPLVIAAGLAVRLVPWRATFTPEGVRFRADTDPYYHALRAQRIAADWPQVTWTDARMNFPKGAIIPWPPLFDWTIAGLARLSTAGGVPSPERVATIAAVFPVFLGLLSIAAAFGIGAVLLDRRSALLAAVFVALLPASVRYSAVGCADQHVAEVLFSTLVLLAFVRGGLSRDPFTAKWRDPLMLGIATCLAFWNWLGSGFYLLLLVGFLAAWSIVAPQRDPLTTSMARALARGMLVAAVLLAVSVGLFAPAGYLGNLGLSGITGLSVVLCLMVFAYAALLELSRCIWPTGEVAMRALQTATALIVPALVPFSMPAFRDGISHGLTALARSNPWYTSIIEFRPILFSGVEPLRDEVSRVLGYFGFTFFLMPVLSLVLIRRWRSDPARRPGTLILFLWGASLFILTLLRTRFAAYLVVPLALWCAVAVDVASAAVGRWPFFGRETVRRAFPIAIAAILMVPGGKTLIVAGYAPQAAGYDSHLIPLLRWLGGQASARPDRPGVMAEWSMGHLIQYFSEMPVLVSPFGTEGGEGAMEDRANFFFDSDPEAAESILRQRRVGFVLLGNPVNEAINTFGFAPRGTPRAVQVTVHPSAGPEVKIRPPFWALVVPRLYYFDGVPHGAAAPAFGSFRLIAEAGRLGEGGPAEFKLFGVVEGARIEIRGAKPDGEVIARSQVTTNAGRVFQWTTRASVDSAGRTRLRLPYATGLNGLVSAGPYTVSDGVHTGTLTLSERDIAGEGMEIDLAH